MIKAKLNGRFEIILPKHRADRAEWYSDEGWEKPRLERLWTTIRDYVVLKGKTPIVYYVGSEEGEMPALCQMWGADVVLFEPNPKVWSNTRAIWEANNLKTPTCIEHFASDKDSGDIKIRIGTWPQSAYEEIEAAHGFKELHTEAETYGQVKIDTVVETEPFPHIITIDVEGSEGHVLRGAEKTLKEFKPYIFLSLHPEFLITQYNEWGAELRKWIRDIGYKETLLEYKHEVHLMYEAL